MTDFSALLDKPLDSFERPLPLPAGGYIGTLGTPKFDKTPPKDGKEGTPFVEFPVLFSEALPDVNQEDLASSLNGRQLTELPQKHTFYLTEAAAFRLKEFLRDHVGVPEGLPTSEAIQQAVGQQAVFVIAHKPGKNPGDVYANISQTAKLPE